MNTVIRPYRSCCLLLGLVLVAGCATGPRFELAGVDTTVTPREAVSELERFRDRKVQWGGVIVSSHNLKDATQLEVLAYPLTDEGRPKTDEEPRGRFIARYPGYLETVDFAPGRLLTVVGTLNGTRTGTVGEMPYTYPVVQMEQRQLWSGPEQRTSPRIHFGIGIGTVIR